MSTALLTVVICMAIIACIWVYVTAYRKIQNDEIQVITGIPDALCLLGALIACIFAAVFISDNDDTEAIIASTVVGAILLGISLYLTIRKNKELKCTLSLHCLAVGAKLIAMLISGLGIFAFAMRKSRDQYTGFVTKNILVYILFFALSWLYIALFPKGYLSEKLSGLVDDVKEMFSDIFD